MVAFVLSTYPTRATARNAGKFVVEKRLAGCVLTMPVGSLYRWKGKVVNTKEVLVVFKTTKEKAKKLMKLVEARHPYEVPFVAALTLGEVNRVKNIFNGVNKKYQQWLAHELRDG